MLFVSETSIVVKGVLFANVITSLSSAAVCKSTSTLETLPNKVADNPALETSPSIEIVSVPAPPSKVSSLVNVASKSTTSLPAPIDKL